MRPVIVICGGWSVTQYDVADLRPRGKVIGVNESAVLFQCDIGITMDRLWAEHRFHQYFTTRAGELWVREGAAKNLPYHPRTRIFNCNHRVSVMSDTKHVYNGTNSGMVALNMAYQMHAPTVYLFGMDMHKGPNGEPYHHAPYEWADPKGATKPGKYKEWQPQFEQVSQAFAARNIRLVQVNDRSAIKTIPSIPFAKFLAETK